MNVKKSVMGSGAKANSTGTDVTTVTVTMTEQEAAWLFASLRHIASGGSNQVNEATPTYDLIKELGLVLL
jgi:hypothetical protein